ncbi:acyl-ACP desaturase [Streptomyces roseirectus]|uniref:Acyl-ACP desaturase n=1 Tax=Streptomyces roseirectus TaxID=2768066 RepID=A0A7H0IMY3_9ACTN|nr:acyl-ACP desaturase [Streptomyces roseirectus]QNP74149.1 acyl-ACP desaturase [Streptomyces roseirectus]
MPIDLRAELEPSVTRRLDHHLTAAREWMPHDPVPWSLSWDFDSSPWHPGQSRLTGPARTVLTLLLAAEEDLPRRHAALAAVCGDRGAWARWLHRWTAERQRHGLALRDYLLTTRAADPVELERARLAALGAVREEPVRDLARTLAHLTVQETSAAVLYRSVPGVPDCGARLLDLVAGDKELHAAFHRSLLDDALLIDPSRTVAAICAELLTFGPPASGVHDLRRHLDLVLHPLLAHWRLTELTGLDADAVRGLDALGALLDGVRLPAPAAPPLTVGGLL